MIMVKIRMWVCCVCVHDTRSIIAPPLPHSLGKTDSLLGFSLLQTVANIEYYIMDQGVWFGLLTELGDALLFLPYSFASLTPL